MSLKRILFISENVALGQVVRLLELAKSLNPQHFEVHFACSSFSPLVFEGTSFRQHSIYTLDIEKINKALNSGSRLYEEETLSKYVEEEIALFRDVQPDLVVSDLRLSTSISAPHCGIPLATLTNAYWSPYRNLEKFPVPDHSTVNIFGEQKAAYFFNMFRAQIFSHFTEPINRLRKKYGLKPVGSLLDVTTYGDYVLLCDTPGLAPLQGAPSHYVYLGPVLWSPNVEPPGWWNQIPDDRPLVYVTLGSSGSIKKLPIILKALGRMPLYAMVSTAGRLAMEAPADNVFVADFLPGDQAAARSALVVSNGGSTTGYQALREGKPLVGVASNLDQYLSMGAIQEAGAGVLLRAGLLTPEALQEGVRRVLDDPSYGEAARRIQGEFMQFQAGERFQSFVYSVTAQNAAASA
jgi:UDP:flavonoid glycosyltransferase YjiC (YdhE family)